MSEAVLRNVRPLHDDRVVSYDNPVLYNGQVFDEKGNSPHQQVSPSLHNLNTNVFLQVRCNHNNTTHSSSHTTIHSKSDLNNQRLVIFPHFHGHIHWKHLTFWTLHNMWWYRTGFPKVFWIIKLKNPHIYHLQFVSSIWKSVINVCILEIRETIEKGYIWRTIIILYNWPLKTGLVNSQ